MTETNIILAIQHALLPHSIGVALVTFLARWLILADVTLAVGLLFSKKKAHRHAVLEAGWGFVLALVLTSAIGLLMQRDRPFLAHTEIVRLIPPPLNTSFPSGHTATAIAIACALAFAEPTVGIVAFLVALLVAFGRVGAGVHYPTDILGGIIVGILSFGIVRFVHRALQRRDIVTSAANHSHES